MRDESSSRDSFAAVQLAAPGLWRALAGWSMWAVCLTVLYTGHALGCRMAALLEGSASAAGTVSWLLVATWAVFLGGHAVLAVSGWRRMRAMQPTSGVGSYPARSLALLTWAMDASAAAATVATGVPVVVVPACVA